MNEEMLVSSAELETPPADAAAPVYRGAPRTQLPDRNQMGWEAVCLDSLISADHPVRIVWAFVEEQDLSPLYELILAREDRPGRTPIAPKLLLALWLNATLDGFGSARELERRCGEDLPYRWLCGGVSVNYHTLSDFRTDHGEFLDELLTRDVAALMAEGLVTLNRMAQDGMRVRASAGASSYRREPTLEACLAEAQARVEALRQELETNPGAASKREQAARERAAREREERVQRALDRSRELQAKAAADKKEKVRVSTTDPEVPVMKMGDGGFRPAANVELATDTGSQIITGYEVTGRGSDQGEMVPMAEQHQQRYERVPSEILVDGGFAKQEDIETAEGPELGATVFAPVPKPKDPNRDRFLPLPGDSETIANWRQRMGTPEAQQIYKERASTAECVNAIARNRGLRQFTVRGLRKIKAVVVLYVLAHNLMRAHTLRMAVA